MIIQKEKFCPDCMYKHICKFYSDVENLISVIKENDYLPITLKLSCNLSWIKGGNT